MGAPVPFERKPSILDRLIPVDPGGELLTPVERAQIQRQGLLQLGMGVLGQQGVGPLQALGRAYGGLDLEGMVAGALKQKAYAAARQQEADTKARIAAVLAQARAIQDPRERQGFIAQNLQGVPGAEKLVEEATRLLSEYKRPRRVLQPAVGPDGRTVFVFVDPEDPTAPPIPLTDYRPVPTGGQGKEPTPAERVAGSQYASSTASIARMRDIAVRNPDAVKAAVAAIHAGGWGKLGKAYAALRGYMNDQDAQDFYTEFNNWLLTATPTYGGSRPTVQLMDLEKGATLPAIGSGDFETAFKHMDARAADLLAKAGKAGPRQGAAPPRSPAPQSTTGNPFAPGGKFYVGRE